MNKTPSKSMEAFIAGAFTFTFSKSFVWTLCFFVASIFDGKPEWIKLAGGIVWSSVGIALGVGILVGKSRARQLVRIFLSMEIIGACLMLAETTLLHLGPSRTEQANLNTASDLIVSVAILILLSWNKPTQVSEAESALPQNNE